MSSVQHADQSLSPSGTEATDQEENHIGLPEGPENNEALGLGVSDTPPWHITILAALQQIMSNIGSIIAAAYIIHRSICPGDNQFLLAELISVSVFMSGLCTILQVGVGFRLPIVQGSSYAFFPVISAMMSTPQWRCPDQNAANSTITDTEPWVPRMLEISGSLAAASCIQVVVGALGLVGLLMRFVGPLTTIPIITLIGLTLVDVAIPGLSTQWGIAALCVSLIVLFSLVLGKVGVPLPVSTKRGHQLVSYPIFRLFPNLFSICVCWLLCYILTITGVFSSDPTVPGYRARTDINLGVISNATWWFLPYPGRHGYPTFGIGTCAGMAAAVISSILESVGDYHATAQVCDVPPPPRHAINRGIVIEGLGSILSGLIGACHATTSYSNTPAIIKITGVRSRVVWIVFGVMMIAFSLCGKIGAALSIVPEVIIASNLLVALGVVVSVGVEPIKRLETNSRNVLILGVSIILGMLIPRAVGSDSLIIDTGNKSVDQVLFCTLSNGLFVGGIIGFLLDNIIPGSKEERGMSMTASSSRYEDTIPGSDIYDVPFVDSLRHTRFFQYLPFLSDTHQDCGGSGCCRRRRNKHQLASHDLTTQKDYYSVETPLDTEITVLTKQQ